MKTSPRTIRFAILALTIGAWLLRPQPAQCYYNPTTGRGLSRDPLNERGFNFKLTARLAAAVNRHGEENLYAFVGNDSIRTFDALGLVGEGGVWPPPPNEVNPPPTGPFKKCRIALSCHMAHGPGNIPVGFNHCGLVIDTGDGVYDLNGSGGTENRRNLTPGSAGDATGGWTDNDSSVCECLFSNIKPWNDKHVPRDNTCANSNWSLKCINKKCNVELDWGSQKPPLGYDCQECSGVTPANPPYMGTCCPTYREKPCPD
jgi:hypothetical protein